MMNPLMAVLIMSNLTLVGMIIMVSYAIKRTKEVLQ